jgi:Family of unknown function (DUF5989)
MSEKKQSEFEAAAGESQVGFFAELWDFLKHNKKWWLLPILIVILGVGVLIVLSSTAAAPFIYTLF